MMALGISLGMMSPGLQMTVQVAAARNVTDCSPRGSFSFICGLRGPEDLVLLPGTSWVVASAFEGGPIQLINARDHSTVPAFPSTTSRYRLDSATYGACPGPLAVPPGSRSTTHGLNIRKGAARVHTLYAVHHGFRESIEVFEVDTATRMPQLTWIGCIPSPDSAYMNSVAPLPDGGLVATRAYRSVGNDYMKGFEGAETGEVHEWHPRTGWRVVPGSAGPGPNGLEASRDGRWLYVALWPVKKIMRLSRGTAHVEKTTVDMAFHPDNLRWQADGSLMVGGQYASGTTSLVACLADVRRCRGTAARVAQIRVGRMTVEEVASYPADDRSFVGTAALLVTKEIWIGTLRGDRMARLMIR